MLHSVGMNVIAVTSVRLLMQHRLCYAVGSSDQITDYVNIVFILYHVEGSMAKEKRVSSCFIIYNSVVPPRPSLKAICKPWKDSIDWSLVEGRWCGLARWNQ